MPYEWERNVRLREAMNAEGVTFAELARVTGKNLKTAQRWVYEGRVPRAAIRDRIAGLVGADATRLWPGLTPDAWTPDLVRLYPYRWNVPLRSWLKLAGETTGQLDVAMVEGWLPDEPLGRVLAERARAGVAVRVGIGLSTPILRCDQAMLVWLRCAVPGLGDVGPVLHLTRSVSGGVFDAYAEVFEVSTRREG